MKILTGLCAASLLVLSACNSQGANQQQAQPFGQGQQPVGPNQQPMQPMQPQPGPGGGQNAALIQQAVQQCIQSAGGAPQAQQICGCFGNALGNLPPGQLVAMDRNPQQAQQFAMQVMQQCAGQAMGGGGMGPGGMGPGGMGPGGMGPGGMGPGGQPGYGPQPGMYGGSAQGGNSQTK